MRGREQERFIIGMVGSSLAVVVVFLLFFHLEIQRLDRQYNHILQKMVTGIETQISDTEAGSGEADVEVYLKQQGYLDMKISRISEGELTGWNRLGVYCVIFFCFLFFAQTLWGVWGFQRVYSQIDSGVDLLTEIIGESKREGVSARWEQWRSRCTGQYGPGAVGRLYEQIWETAQVVRERETDRVKEQKYLRDLMSDISHQMKTPLSSLQVFVDVFSREVARNAEATTGTVSVEDREQNTQLDTIQQKHTLGEMVVQADRQIERMRWLVMGMLKLAQVESGVLQWDNRLQPVRFTVEKSVDALRTNLLLKQQRVEISGDRDILLEHDAGWLQEAMVNLLKNASEYAPEQGVILADIQQTALAVVLTIEDNGPGIERVDLPKIFNRFYRVRTKEHGDGVGIGLALAKSIIEAQGGTITVFSQTGEASFTRFVITFLAKLQGD